jgi:uncharacterized protein (TIGR03084 family)
MSVAARLDDLAEEIAELDRLIDRAEVNGDDPTAFQGWRVRDSIGHLVTIDALAVAAFTDRDAFADLAQAFLEGVAGDPPAAVFRRIAKHEDRLLGHLSWRELIDRWNAGAAMFVEAAQGCGEEDRVPWFGGEMKAASLIAARQMEVWAYGRDVFDRYDTRRREGGRLRNVAEFGIKTMAFSFANRGEPVPETKPFIALAAPDGAEWRWNDPAATDRITGDAVDFCLVVTQRRHVHDTHLTVTGDNARRWLQIAQCIAGPPVDGPPPRARIPDPAAILSGV